MISCNTYAQNKQKYQNLVEYTKSHQPKIEEDLEKEILKVMEKYKIAIGWMEEENVEELIEKCVTKGSNIPLKKELHGLVTGNFDRLDDRDGESESRRRRSKEDREDDCFNLD